MTDRIKGRRIALVGGAGFIGHHLALALKRAGAIVEVIDSLQVNNLLSFASSSSGQANRELHLKMLNERLDLLRHAEIPLQPQDARDYHALSRLLNAFQPNVIIHLAAISHAGKANKDPYSTFDHSLRTLENSLDYSRGNAETGHARIDQFIYFSSSMAYGDFQTDPVDEEHPLNPIGIYGALKLAGEKIVIAYQQAYGLPYTIIRPSALYGPRCVSGRVIQVFIENALKGQELVVQGDGKEKLDFTHIDDLVAGVLATIGNPPAQNEVFNMTFGEGRALNEVAQLVLKEFPGLGVRHEEREPLRPMRGTLSVEKARRLVGYSPKMSVDRGIPEYIKDYRRLTGGVRVYA